MGHNYIPSVLILLLLSILISCENGINFKTSLKTSAFTEIEKSDYLTGDQLRVLMQENDNLTIIDIRSTPEYNESHIEGAKHIPLKDILNEETRKFVLSAKGPIVIYGNSYEEIHGPFMLFNAMENADFKLLRESYAVFINPERGEELALGEAKFDYAKEWKDLIANTKIDAPEAEIPKVAKVNPASAQGSGQSEIPILPKKKKKPKPGEGC